MDAAAVVVTSLLAALFVLAGVSKLAASAQSIEIRDRLAVPPRAWQGIGVLEIAGAAGALLGFAVSAIGFAATGGLILLMVGAIASHVRAGDSPSQAAPAVFYLLLAAAALALQIAAA
jgi:uncharacterized membrane protein YphA (DoxX/SURF4 family)